jgi:Rap1a immunity proteins
MRGHEVVMKLRLFVVLLLFVILTINAPAEDFTDSGNAFLRQCSVVEKTSERITLNEAAESTACATYIGGLEDGIILEQYVAETQLHTKVPMPYCTLDAGLENQQVVRIVLKYIRENPATAHISTRMLFLIAMEKAFPCPEADSKKKH